jgi:hypothetical protein
MTNFETMTYNKPGTIKTPIILLAILLANIFMPSCKTYLDVKPDKKLVQPSSLQDAQALLDNYFLNSTYSMLGPEGDDDYYLLDVDFNRMPAPVQQRYTWQEGAIVNDYDWSNFYSNVLFANMALETVQQVSMNSENKNSWQQLKGAALFFRAYNLYWAAMYFTVPYDEAIAATMPGIPLRLTSDVNEQLSRGTLAQTYDRIIGDIAQSIPLLPNAIDPVSRPSKAAAYGFMARVYMSMRNYTKAGMYADSCLTLKSDLLNYNNVDTTTKTPFKNFNKEVIFHSEGYASRATYSPTAKTDTVLYAQYEAGDLRRPIFFAANSNGTHSFKGSYAGSNYYDVPFNGIATDEMLLVRAECFARNNDLTKALADLNTLLITRYVSGTYIPKNSSSQQAVLQMILTERRKELVGRGLRWADLRRLNVEPSFQKTLVRKENGQIYQLSPGDKRYTFFIPSAVIGQNGWPQNER